MVSMNGFSIIDAWLGRWETPVTLKDFVHDYAFEIKNGDDCIYEFQNQYYVRNYGKVLIDRYLSVFDYVYLAWRTRNVKSEASLGQYNIPIDKRAKVIGIPFFQGPIGYARVYHKLRKK